MKATTPQSITNLRKQMRADGFLPIPVNGKIPTLKAWQKKTKIDDDEIERWETLYPRARNTGLLTCIMPTLDADILNQDASEAIEALVRERFKARGRILVRVGRPPKRAIPFRTDKPFEKITVRLTAPDGDTSQKLELLADGQQVVGFGIHEGTHKPYTWHGAEAGAVKLKELPLINEAEAQALVDDLAKLLREKFGYQVASSSKKGNGTASEDWGPLLANIYAGHNLHDSIRDLACKLIFAGMEGGAVVNMLRAAMNECTAPHDERWQERYDDIPRAVETADELKSPTKSAEPPAKQTLEAVHTIFHKWLGDDYDIDAINATCAVAACEKLTGDPPWLLLVSGPGAAKTETAQATAGAGAYVTSTIASEGALPSATSAKSRSKKATGGLLRKIGASGILVIKDFTTIISSDRNVRQTVLAAIREIYDGRWERNVGTDGGQTLTWTGRIIIIAAVTTAWDSAHQVVAACGDRFVLLRINSNINRQKSGSRAIANTGNEVKMREELAAAVGGLMANICTDDVKIEDSERDQLLKAADITTMARTAVERGYRGDVDWVHDPEMPTRFAKQLTQIVRGGVAIGMSREAAIRLAIRCARDSVPPRRLEILLDIAVNPNSRPRDVCRRTGVPWQTTRREMEALTMLKMLRCDELNEQDEDDEEKRIRHVWRYSLDANFDRATLLAMNAAGAERAKEFNAVNVSEGCLGDIIRGNPAPDTPSTHIYGANRKARKPSKHKAKTTTKAKGAVRSRTGPGICRAIK